jgi:hypothetical protein
MGLDYGNTPGFRDFTIGHIPAQRTISDGVTVAGSPIIASATAAFVAGDVGRGVSGQGIPIGIFGDVGIVPYDDSRTQIISVNVDGIHATLNRNATRTLSGLYMEFAVYPNSASDDFYIASHGALGVQYLFPIYGAIDFLYRMKITGSANPADSTRGGLLVVNGNGSANNAFAVTDFGGDPFLTVSYNGVTKLSSLSMPSGYHALEVLGHGNATGDIVGKFDTHDAGHGAFLWFTDNGAYNYGIGTDGSGNAAWYANRQDTIAGTRTMGLTQAGDLTVLRGGAFWGHAAVASQPVAPTLLADVIAIIRGCGLSA